jgi:hypothetical protein
MNEQLEDKIKKPSNLMLIGGTLRLLWDAFILFSAFLVMREPFGASAGAGILWFVSIVITLMYLSKLGKDMEESYAQERFNNKDNK